MGNIYSSSAWALYLLTIVILLVCIGIIAWIYVDSVNTTEPIYYGDVVYNTPQQIMT